MIKWPPSIDFLDWAEIVLERIQILCLRSPSWSLDFSCASIANPCDDSRADPCRHSLLSLLPVGARLYNNHIPNLKTFWPRSLVIFPDHIFVRHNEDSSHFVAQTRNQLESIFQLRGCLHKLGDLAVVLGVGRSFGLPKLKAVFWAGARSRCARGRSSIVRSDGY